MLVGCLDGPAILDVGYEQLVLSPEEKYGYKGGIWVKRVWTVKEDEMGTKRFPKVLCYVVQVIQRSGEHL